jgi:glycosyltransferase involved in cell wall biosynthesis
MNSTFPKVLIIGYPFDKVTGGGITLTNLFLGWPKDRLALASNSNLHNSFDLSVCEKFYQLGYKNKLHPFPLSIFLPEIKIGPIDTSILGSGLKKPSITKTRRFKNIYNYLKSILHFLGIYNSLYKLKVTPEFMKWFNGFNPDFIYSQLSTLELIRFVSELKGITGKHVAVHIMDDWPVSIDKPGLLSFYWRKTVEKEFRNLLDKSTALMSIGEAMSEEYKRRYDKTFIPFHNPIDTDRWLPYSKTDYALKEYFTILYAGRIGFGVKNSIKNIVSAVNEFCRDHTNVCFEIQTNDFSELNRITELNQHVKWIKPVDYSKLPQKFSSVDLLVLPCDFDTKSIEFLRFSFLTKIAEYMVSGTPVLVVADRQTAIAKYALSEKWAYVVLEENIPDLITALSELYNNFSLRKELGERAKTLALMNEDATIVRENFRKAFYHEEMDN